MWKVSQIQLRNIDKFKLRQQSISFAIYMFKGSKKNNVSDIFKVNNKDTRTTSGASIVNFEHVPHFILLILLLNSNK